MNATIDLLLSAVNAAGDAIVILEADGADLRLVYANQAFFERTGYERAEAIGKPLEFFRRGMPDDPGMQQVRAAVAQGVPVRSEVCSYRKDGRSFWNQVAMEPIRSAAGTITHWISVERDVTEAIERESRLEDRNQRLVSLGRAARDLFGALDLPALSERFRAAVRELAGADAQIISAADAIDGAPSESRLVVPAGDSFRADVRAPRPIGDSDRLVIELLAQYFAVAARNASLVAEIEDQRNAVVELNQIKTDLIAMLAHDFKGPLTNILGYADLTAEMGAVNDDQAEYLEAIRRSAMRLADLATDTLALSRLERNEIDLLDETVDLAGLLQDVIAANATRRIDFEARGETVVRGDAQRLRQVFANIVENAVKYSPSGEPVLVRAQSEGATVRVSVIDRGIGIPPAEIARVFDRFARAANARRKRIPGTGFGLFLCKQIVEMHGGTIQVQSRENEGSTFTVSLPAANGEARHPLRVVVAENKDESRSFLTHALRGAGMRARHVPALSGIGADDLRNADCVVVDADAAALGAPDLARLRSAATKEGVRVIVIGQDLRKPYLMRDLVALVQGGKTRSGAE